MKFRRLGPPAYLGGQSDNAFHLARAWPIPTGLPPNLDPGQRRGGAAVGFAQLRRSRRDGGGGRGGCMSGLKMPHDWPLFHAFIRAGVAAIEEGRPVDAAAIAASQAFRRAA